MPRRKHTLDKHRESAIAGLLKKAREQMRLEQAEVAEKVGLTRDQWQNVERGRTPLRYAIAFELRQVFGLSLDYLAGMPREMLSPDLKRWPSPNATLSLNKAIFSDVALELFANMDRGLGLSRNPDLPQNFAGPTNDRAEWADFFSTYIAQRLAMVVPNKVGELSGAMLDGVNAAAAKFETYPAMAKVFFDQIKEYQEWKRSQPEDESGSGPITDDIDNLDNKPEADIVGGVKVKAVPTWPQLRMMIAEQTTKRGDKAALATKLNVTPQVLNNWLRDREQGAPDAETTLKLLEMFWKPAK